MPAQKVSDKDFLKISKRIKAAGGSIKEIAAETGLDAKSVSVKLSGIRKKIAKTMGAEKAKLVPTFQRGRSASSADELVNILVEDDGEDAGDDNDNT